MNYHEWSKENDCTEEILKDLKEYRDRQENPKDLDTCLSNFIDALMSSYNIN